MAEPISIQDFQKVDLRVGRVTDVRDHPNASKLYVMKVDLGPELGTRQMVAGLKPYMTADTLKDQLVASASQLKVGDATPQSDQRPRRRARRRRPHIPARAVPQHTPGDARQQHTTSAMGRTATPAPKPI